MHLRVPSAIVAAVCEPAWDLYEGSVRLRTLRALRRSQWFDAARLEEMRAAALRELLAHAARTSPFHARRLAAAGIDPEGVRGISDLAGLPLLTKDDVREHLDDLLSTAYRREHLTPAKTGGSTGVALRVYCDRRGIERRAAAALRADEWSGWRLGQPIAAVWGNPQAPRGWRGRLRRLLKERVFFLDTMRIDDAAIERFAADWRRWRPGLLFGHAHSVCILAEAIAAKGLELPPPRGIVTSSMMLLRPERQTIERTFGVPVTNRYGCEEVSLIACECERHDGLHVNAEHVCVEVLRDDGAPCAPGEDGRIVVTELVNRGLPMLRYEVGDRGALAAGACGCGRAAPRLAAVTGRTADFLRAQDGARVAGVSLIENTLTRLPGIKQMQLVQEQPLALRVNLVPAAGYDAATAAALAAILRGALGDGFAIDIVETTRIPPEASGKYRFSICRLPGC